MDPVIKTQDECGRNLKEEFLEDFLGSLRGNLKENFD